MYDCTTIGMPVIGELYIFIRHYDHEGAGVVVAVGEDVTKPTGDILKVGDFIANRIAELGVRDYFTVPGDTNLDLLDCLLENKHLRMVSCCNELNAGYAADGYARTAAAQVAVVVIPYIVGGLSIINAIAGAHSEDLKVIVISGCPTTTTLAEDQFLHHTPSPANRDQALHAFQGVTAAAVRVKTAETAVDIIDGAIMSCLCKSRPVYIEIPNDIATASCSSPGSIPYTPQLMTNGRKIEDAFKTILAAWDNAESPVMIIGRSARQFLSRNTIQTFGEKLGCPILCQPDGRLFLESHPQYGGVYWLGIGNQNAEKLVQGSDLWLVIGGCWSDFHGSSININKDRYRIISLERDRVDVFHRAIIEGVSPSYIAERLVSSSLRPKTGHFSVDELELAHPPKIQLDKSDAVLTISNIIAGVEDILSGHDTLIADIGESWFATNLITLPPGADCLLQTVYSSIGWAAPAALGSQVARLAGRTIVLIGDGALQMTVQELSTMIRMKSNPIILVLNNLGYKIETAIHEGPYNYIADWDYTKVASAFVGNPHVMPYNPYCPEEGTYTDNPIFTMQVKTQKDLVSALERAKAGPSKLAFLECCIHPDDLTPGLRRMGNAISEKIMVPPPDSGYATSDSGDSYLTDTHPGQKLHGSLRASDIIMTLTATPGTTLESDNPNVLNFEQCTDHMVRAHWTSNQGWNAPELVPYGPLSLMPTASVLHYATSCFEGLKAYRGNDSKLRLFRPNYNCERMLNSAKRLGLPAFNPEELLKLIQAVLAVDAPQWLPSDQGGSFLYIRPTLIASGKGLGIKGPTDALLYIILLPCADPMKCLKGTSRPGFHLLCSPKDMIRAWPGGTGAANIASNYGPSIPAQEAACEQGCDLVLWLYGPDRLIIDAGTSNFFLVWVTKYGKLELITPPLDNGTILPGLTRHSILEIARARLTTGPIVEYQSDGSWRFLEPLSVVERDIAMHDVLVAHDEHRLRGAFVVGTEYGITPVSSIQFEEQEIRFPEELSPYLSLLQKWYFGIVFGEEKNNWAEVVEG
ncbi:Pyruvate decarboxylase 3 [Aspergillus nanangensis]|uniref:Pyruvate decarboxylase n=1 Tax=Aspergillus nanangensis TaxID=2582783 RepID=A0AAD4CN24_ASPNN|nr:Pyruvate decarboxylase 3 [Aspergillus nanangensis]